MLAVRTDRDDSDGRLKEVLEEFDIVFECLWELVFGSKLGHVGLPTGEFFVDGLNVVDRVGELVGHGAVLQLIAHASLDGVETVENIALHHDELGDSVDHDAVAQLDEVDPTAAALTTGDSSIFVADGTDSLTSLVEEFCGERT